MRFLRLTTNYPDYLARFYATRAALEVQPYAVQYQALMADGFHWCDALPKPLANLGYEMNQVIANAEPMQKQWAGENGVKYTQENWLHDIAAAQVHAFCPEVLFVYDYSTFTAPFLRRLKAENPLIRLTLGWCGAPYSDPAVFGEYDVVLSCIPELVEQFRADGHQAEHVNHAFNPQVLERIDTSVLPHVDFSFSGQIVMETQFHRKREELLRALAANTALQLWSEFRRPPLKKRLHTGLYKAAYDAIQAVRLTGVSQDFLRKIPVIKKIAGWQARPTISWEVAPVIRRRARKPVFGLTMFQLLHDSRITLNSHIDISPRSASNMRLYEATGVGTCLLTDWKENLSGLFEPEREVVTYKSADEAIEKVRYLLNHESERTTIAAAGQRRTLRDHTANQRAGAFAEIIRRELGEIVMSETGRWLRLSAYALVFACALIHQAGALEFNVATNGDDNSDGTLEKPFVTIDRAREAIRALKGAGAFPSNGVTVLIHGGAYSLTNSFALTREDSGTRKSPIIYCGFAGEHVEIIGGKELTGFKPIRDPVILQRLSPVARTNVLQVGLSSLGITDYGELPFDSLELYFNDKPMTLARWPNDQWTLIATTPAGDKGPTITCSTDRPGTWAWSPDIWMHGYWGQDWADQYLRIASIGADKKSITIADPQSKYGYHSRARYYVLNVLEELDEPGEWYLDRKTGTLYFWPPSPVSQGKAIGSVLKEPLFLLHDTSFVTMSNLTFSATRGPAVQIIGGTNNRVAWCRIHNVGGVGVALGNAFRNTSTLIYNAATYDGNCGFSNGIENCDIFDTGLGGVILGGGNRLTLTAGNNYASHNIIARFNRLKFTYAPAIHVFGVGNRVDHNLISDSPHTAILLNGNDHVIEYNEIHDVCLDTRDTGAIYMGRNLSERGNVFRYNLLHDMPRIGIYLDDFSGGSSVYGNIFDKVGMGMQLCAGSANRVESNLFISCDRGIGFGDPIIKMDILSQRMQEVRATRPPYTTRYPELRNYSYLDLTHARGTRFTHNVIVGGTPIARYCSYADQLDLSNNLTNLPPDSIHSADRYAIPQQPTTATGWNGQLNIPVAQIGRAASR